MRGEVWRSGARASGRTTKRAFGSTTDNGELCVEFADAAASGWFDGKEDQ
jgi:hypothetical protein